MTQKGELTQVTNTYFSKDFEDVNEELRKHFQLANREIDNVKDKVNVLVSIVHKDNKDWTIKKICAYIAGKNDDLNEFGFSANTIYNYLDEENRKLIDARKQRKPKKLEHQPSQSLEDLRNKKGTIVQNNVMDQSGQTFDQNVTEESSSTSVEDVEDLRGDEQDVVYDPKFVDDLITEKSKLEESYTEYITPFKTTYTWTYKEQHFPLILKIDPYKKIVISIELDEKEARKQNKK